MEFYEPFANTGCYPTPVKVEIIDLLALRFAY
jgi:hypothetical protein